MMCYNDEHHRPFITMNTTEGFCPHGPHILVKEGREDRQKESKYELVMWMTKAGLWVRE